MVISRDDGFIHPGMNSNDWMGKSLSDNDVKGFDPVDFTHHSINVLFADWDDGLYESVQELQIEYPDIRVVGIATDSHSLMENARNLFAEVFVIAYDLPGSSAIQLIQRLVEAYPHVPIVVMVSESEVEHINRLIQVGAKEVLVKPTFTLNELANVIRKAYQDEIKRREAEKHAARTRALAARQAKEVVHASSEVEVRYQKQRVISFYSPKGGVGTSTLAVNTALIIAKELEKVRAKGQEAKICLLDLDFGYGNIDSMVMLPNKTNIYDVINTYDPEKDQFDSHALDKALVRHPAVQLDLLFAPSRLEFNDIITDKHIRALLRTLREREYDIIICDTTTELRDTTIEVLQQSQRIMFVVTQDLSAIRTSEQVLDTFKDALGIRPGNIRLILNQLIQGNGIAPNEIHEYLNYPISATIPDDRRLISTSINEGKPLALGQGTPMLNAMKRVAGLVSPELGIKVSSDVGGGGFTSLFGRSSNTKKKVRQKGRARRRTASKKKQERTVE